MVHDRAEGLFCGATLDRIQCDKKASTFSAEWKFPAIFQN